MIRALFINGPPYSGKDTLAGRIATQREPGVYDIVHAKISLPLKLAASAIFPGIPFLDEVWMSQHKDRQQDLLEGKTPRKVLIDLSENFFVPTFGDDYFGRKAVAQIKTLQDGSSIVYSDSGFAREMVPLVQHLGSLQCTIVRLRRRGTDYSKDSRGPLLVEGVRSFDIQNTSFSYLDKIAAWGQRFLRDGKIEDPPLA